MQVLEDMHKCLDIPELSYVDDTMGLFIMLPRAMGSSSKATHKLSKATTSWRPGKLLPATPLKVMGHVFQDQYLLACLKTRNTMN